MERSCGPIRMDVFDEHGLGDGNLVHFPCGPQVPVHPDLTTDHIHSEIQR